MATQWPRVTARLVALLPTLTNWQNVRVYDGPPPTDNLPANYATVGQTSVGEWGNFHTEQHASGYRYMETGTVACEINCAVGERDITTVRAAVFAALDDLDAQIRADRRLGVLSGEGTSALMVTLSAVTDANGTAYIARFSLNYFTVT